MGFFFFHVESEECLLAQIFIIVILFYFFFDFACSQFVFINAYKTGAGKVSGG